LSPLLVLSGRELVGLLRVLQCLPVASTVFNQLPQLDDLLFENALVRVERLDFVLLLRRVHGELELGAAELFLSVQ